MDGGSRDTELIIAQGFLVFCSFLTSVDIVARWVPDRYGEPVTIGAVKIATGDYVLGDRDGVVVVGRARCRSHRADRGGRLDGERNEARSSAAWTGRRVREVRQILKPERSGTGPAARATLAK
ncbi:MAG TPA: hypothetical protein VF814_07580 [Casimicrobiaceae bacterium]